MSDHTPTVVLDFDGVIHSYVSGWTGPVPTDPPEEGAREVCNYLIQAGYRVVVQTTRAATEEGLAGTIAWLVEHDFPQMVVTAEKVPAIAYVDDRAVSHRPGTDDWMHVYSEIGRLRNGTR